MPSGRAPTRRGPLSRTGSGPQVHTNLRGRSKRTERGAIRKPKGSAIPVALVYPNAYRVGMGNLGFQFLYARFNEHPAFAAERFFIPDSPAEGRTRGGTPVSEETGRPLAEFPIIAFSIPFENDEPAIPAALAAAGIPPLQADRRPDHPIVMAGGVAVSLNPEPLACFLDLIFVGELVEDAIRDHGGLFDLLAVSVRLRGDREALLKRFGMVPSVYVPSAYTLAYHDDGRIASIHHKSGFPERVRAAKRRGARDPVPVSVIFSPEAEFGEIALIEVNRGCGRGCRFCSGGWIHLPSRMRPFEAMRRDVEAALREGRTVGLVGSDLAGHPQLTEILHFIVERGGKFSLSSIRPEGLTPDVIDLMARSGQKTATLAPEVASDRLKNVVGKQIPAESFFTLTERLVAAGIPNVRFYFMIGLPTETDDDIQAMVDFVLRAREVFVNASRLRRRIGRLSVQVNPFVPKPWTPFQWAAMESPEELDRRVALIRTGLKHAADVTLRIESPRHALIQAVLSRGDRRMAPALLHVGGKADALLRGFKKEHLDPVFYALRERGPDEVFPWEVVDHGVPRQALRKLHEVALKAGRERTQRGRNSGSNK